MAIADIKFGVVPLATEEKTHKHGFLEKATAIEVSQSTPGRIRTCDLLIRSQLLYPAELRGQRGFAKWNIVLQGTQCSKERPAPKFDKRVVYLFAAILSTIVYSTAFR